MTDLATLQGIAGGAAANALQTDFVDDVVLVVPTNIGIYAAHVVSDGAPVGVTLPAAATTRGAFVTLLCPNGGANAVTITPRQGTINGLANLVVSGANTVTCIAIRGNTDWKALVAA